MAAHSSVKIAAAALLSPLSCRCPDEANMLLCFEITRKSEAALTPLERVDVVLGSISSRSWLSVVSSIPLPSTSASSSLTFLTCNVPKENAQL